MIRWATDSLDRHPEIRRGDAPPGLLGPAEARALDGLRIPKRRRDWLIGRHTLKSLLVDELRRRSGWSGAPADLEVRPTLSGAPEVWVGDVRLDLRVSITHSAGRAATALSPHPSASVGIDLETVAPRPRRFVDDYLTGEEAELVLGAPADERDRLITTIWSGKEAILKALHLGLRVNPKRVTCGPGRRSRPGDGWQPLWVTASPEVLERAGVDVAEASLRGWWRPLGDQVLTLVTCDPGPRLSTPQLSSPTLAA